MFRTIDYLRTGNAKQRHAYEAITSLRVMEELRAYTPVLCGTIPIGMDVEGSDLDIILDIYATELMEAEQKIKKCYSRCEGFQLLHKEIRGIQVMKANFFFMGFEFELFGQAVPVQQQNAYLHMIIEYKLLQKYPDWKNKILSLKQQGMKTEPAFAKMLALEGDPFKALLDFGREQGWIE